MKIRKIVPYSRQQAALQEGGGRQGMAGVAGKAGWVDQALSYWPEQGSGRTIWEGLQGQPGAVVPARRGAGSLA